MKVGLPILKEGFVVALSPNYPCNDIGLVVGLFALFVGKIEELVEGAPLLGSGLAEDLVHDLCRGSLSRGAHQLWQRWLEAFVGAFRDVIEGLGQLDFVGDAENVLGGRLDGDMGALFEVRRGVLQQFEARLEPRGFTGTNCL